MKKGIAILLVMSILLPCIAVPAYASPQNESRPQINLDMSLLSAETQETFNEQMESIATQLCAQDAMEQYDFYAATVYSELLAIEQTEIMPLADLVFNEPYGAFVTYTYPDSNGKPYITTSITYMNPAKTQAVITDNLGNYLVSTTIEGALVSFLGYIPHVSNVATTVLAGLLTAEAIIDASNIYNINNCGNYSLLQSSAFAGKSEFACVLRPWNNHDTVIIPGHVTDITYHHYSK